VLIVFAGAGIERLFSSQRRKGAEKNQVQ